MTDFAGVASSGVQACSAIATYIGSLKHRDEDLASINRQAQALESVFQALSLSLTQSSSNPSTSSAAAQVSSSMGTCEAELNNLKQLIARFSDHLPPNARPQDRLLQQAAKLKYPLRKPDISRIQESLGVIKENLSLAIQNLELRYSQLEISKLNAFEEAFEQASGSLNLLSSNVSTLGDLVSPLQEQIPAIQSAVDSLPPLVNMKADMQLAQIQELHRQSAQSTEALSDTVSGLHVKLDAVLDLFHQDFTTATTAFEEPNSRMSVYKLVSRPSNLAALCASLDNQTYPENAASTVNVPRRTPTAHASSCPCRQRSVYRAKRVSWWSWDFWDSEALTFRHYKGCKYFRSNGDERSRLRGLKLTGFLKSAIIITFNTSTGAGGHSLGSSLAFYATVDRETSPTFRVIQVLDMCLHNLGWQERCRTEESLARWERLALAATQKLDTLFRSGKAGAKDVDSENQSLLHATAEMIYNFHTILDAFSEAYCPPIAQLARFLVKMQVPASLRDLHGYQAFRTATPRVQFSVPFAAAFYPEEAAIDAWGNKSEPSRSLDRQNLTKYLDYFTTIPRVAEVHHGPLSLAVLSNDQGQTYRLLRKHPEYLEERGHYWGWTPLHLAIRNPECLQILVERCSPHHLVQADDNGYTVLGYAILLSKVHCDRRGDQDESLCRCTLPLRILLYAGCPIIPYRDFRSHHTAEGVVASASRHCKAYLAKSLVQRRQKLKSVAQEYLSPQEVESFKLHEAAVLDIYAMQVDEILRHRGYIELGPLTTYVDEEPPRGGDCPRSPVQEYRSIYHDLTTLEDAETYFGLGFHDISARPSMPMIWKPSYVDRWQYLRPSFLKWLLDHDAPLYEWMTGSKAADGHIADAFVLAIFGGYNARNEYAEKGDEEVARVLEQRMLSDRSVDGCHCRCSPGGCTPIVERMKEMEMQNDELEIAAEFTAYLEEYGDALQREHYQAAIRFTTFQALGIAHTCIRISRSRYVHELAAEEIEDIQYEYAELLELLELLVEEFEAHAFEAFDAATDGLDSMIAFWDGYWVDRMGQVLSDLSQAGDASKRAAEELGVVWVPEPDITRFEWRG